MSSKVTIIYPFHPYYQQQLEIILRPRKPAGCFVVRDPTGRDLTIPRWMIESSTTQFIIGDCPHLPLKNLRALYRLIESAKNTMISGQKDTMKGEDCVSNSTVSRKEEGDKSSNTRGYKRGCRKPDGPNDYDDHYKDRRKTEQ